jgi:PKHD-type hydroxylase
MPEITPRQNWRLWVSSFDVQMVLDEAASLQTSEATTFGGANLDYRRSRVAWLTSNEMIKQALIPYAQEAADIMGINIIHSCEIQFTEYLASEGGKYDWHHDVDLNNNTVFDRKLSLTVQLSDPSDYDGGDFQFAEVENPNGKAMGSVLVFPSYLQHRVLPVTRGTRRSLVAWFSGPRWS